MVDVDPNETFNWVSRSETGHLGVMAPGTPAMNESKIAP